MEDLELNEEVVVPELSIYEEPEQLLTVKDEEVTYNDLFVWIPLIQ